MRALLNIAACLLMRALMDVSKFVASEICAKNIKSCIYDHVFSIMVLGDINLWKTRYKVLLTIIYHEYASTVDINGYFNVFCPLGCEQKLYTAGQTFDA
jgi:hypothetical protein